MQLLSSVQQWLSKKNFQLLLVTLLYYVSLVFVNANLHLLVATSLYSLAVYWITKQWWLTIWLVFLITLPFAKGRTLVFTLIPKEELVARNAVFDINYILSFYLSDGVLLLLYWLILRQPLDSLKKLIQALQPLRWLCLTLVVFLGVIIWPHRSSILFSIVLLSSLQLIKAVFIFLLPLALLSVFRDQKKQFLPLTYFGLLSTVFFQTALSVLQFLSGGQLGWYIEAILPLGSNGQPMAISTMENQDILRVTGSFFDPSLLGTLMFSALIWIWYQRPVIKPKWLRWLAIIATNITMILTSNRLLMITLVIWWGYHAVLTFKRYRDQQQKLFKQTQLALFVGISALLLIFIFPYVFIRLNSLTNLFAKYGSGTYRIEQIQYAVRLANEQPWGVGLNLSPYYLATQFNQEVASFDPVHPHNIFFQVLAETGYSGVATAIWLIYLIYRPIHIMPKRQLTLFLSGTGAAGLAYLYCAQFYPVFINQIETFSWLLLFLGLYWVEKQRYASAKKH